MNASWTLKVIYRRSALCQHYSLRQPLIQWHFLVLYILYNICIVRKSNNDSESKKSVFYYVINGSNSEVSSTSVPWENVSLRGLTICTVTDRDIWLSTKLPRVKYIGGQCPPYSLSIVGGIISILLGRACLIIPTLNTLNPIGTIPIKTPHLLQRCLSLAKTEIMYRILRAKTFSCITEDNRAAMACHGEKVYQ